MSLPSKWTAARKPIGFGAGQAKSHSAGSDGASLLRHALAESLTGWHEIGELLVPIGAKPDYPGGGGMGILSR